MMMTLEIKLMMNNVNKDNTMHNDDVANVVDDGVIDDAQDVANNNDY